VSEDHLLSKYEVEWSTVAEERTGA
jgi:hypothetical protein